MTNDKDKKIMRTKLFLAGVCALTLSGCHTAWMYSRSAPQKPVRWPDNVKLCGVIQEVVVPLKILVTYNQIPFMPVSYLSHPQPGAGCGYTEDDKTIPFTNQAYIGIGSAMKIDNGSHYRTYQVWYNFMLASNRMFTPNMYYSPHWVQKLSPYKADPSLWRFNRPIGKSTTVTINGLKWTHTLFYGFESRSRDPADPATPATISDSLFPGPFTPPVVSVKHPKALARVGEVYAHKINDHYKILVWAHYNRPVAQDAHWFKVRRALLRKLVKAITITPLTPERLKKLKARHQKQEAKERSD